jgi:hypothetical protein
MDTGFLHRTGGFRVDHPGGTMTTFRTLSRQVSYLLEFVHVPHKIGSVLPSSRYLCREMLAQVDWQSALDCGTGRRKTLGLH